MCLASLKEYEGYKQQKKPIQVKRHDHTEDHQVHEHIHGITNPRVKTVDDESFGFGTNGKRLGQLNASGEDEDVSEDRQGEATNSQRSPRQIFETRYQNAQGYNAQRYDRAGMAIRIGRSLPKGNCRVVSGPNRRRR